jgi:hypothetical protein
MGRRKRFRLVMRLEAKARGSVIIGDEEIRVRNEEKKTWHKEESKRRGKMMAMATRLARRPWKKHEQEEVEKTKTGREVIGMKRDTLKRLLRVIQQTMDTPSRSIATMNLKKLIKARGDVVFTIVMMNSVMMSDKAFVKDVKKGLKAWCVQWEKVAKVLIVLNVTVAPKATKSMIDILNSTGSWGKKEKEECKCVCNEEQCNTWQKWKGHVLHPLSKFLANEDINMPESWNIRSRCAADPEKVEKEFAQTMQKMHRNALQKTKWKGKAIAMPAVYDDVMRRQREKMERRGRETPSEKAVEELKEKLKGVVVCPVDKDHGEGRIVCPKCWAESVEAFAGEMQELTRKEEGQRRIEMTKAGENLGHLPFVNLGRMKKHEFGVLRTWPKTKTVKKVQRVMELEERGIDRMEWTDEDREVWEAGWEAIRWRPLVSYAKHRWKGLFRLLGQFCSTIARTLKLGILSSSSRGVLERAHEYNERNRKPGGVNSRRKKGRKKKKNEAQPGPMKTRILRRRFLDIKNFFIRIPRGGLVERVKVLIKRLKTRMPDVKYFSVEQVARLSLDTEVPRDVMRQGGWRRIKPSARQGSCFTATTRKGWRSVLLDDIVDIFDMDEKYGIVMALQKGYVPKLGFQIVGKPQVGVRTYGRRTQKNRKQKKKIS